MCLQRETDEEFVDDIQEERHGCEPAHSTWSEITCLHLQGTVFYCACRETQTVLLNVASSSFMTNRISKSNKGIVKSQSM